jgi:hypothetical protein
MHDLPDTDDADAAAERYWPEEYKWVIKTDLRKSFEAALQETGDFSGFYQKGYTDPFDTYEAFIHRLAEGVVIGTENGVDDSLEEIHRALGQNNPLPDQRVFAVYLQPHPFDEKLKNSLRREVFEEFRTHPIYRHIYEDHYQTRLSFDEFVDQLARLVVLGAMNGADKTLGDIYRAFLFSSPLPAFRRRPRRVR